VKKRKIKILDIIIVSVILLLIGLFLIPALRVPLRPAYIGMAEAKCRDITFFLEKYYEQLEQTTDEPKSADLVKFIDNHRYKSRIGFSSQAPDGPLSILDFGVYLLLPKKLESNLPTLIAYTTPIKQWKTEKFFRVCLFLNGTHMTATALPDHSSVDIIGKERLEQAEPDFYYYRVKQESEKTQPTSQNKDGSE
jgi:hypothetical protein